MNWCSFKLLILSMCPPISPPKPPPHTPAPTHTAAGLMALAL